MYYVIHKKIVSVEIDTKIVGNSYGKTH